MHKMVEGVTNSLIHPVHCTNTTIKSTQFTIFYTIGIMPARSLGQRHVHQRTTIRLRSGLTLFLFSWTPARMINCRSYSKASRICLVDHKIRTNSTGPLAFWLYILYLPIYFFTQSSLIVLILEFNSSFIECLTSGPVANNFGLFFV